jgi:hypothetical protein
VRVKKQLYKQDNETKKTMLRQDVLIVRIQRLFRGYKSRKNNRDRIKLQENGIDWIEVRDRESGDVWFYNKRTAVSQWSRPDDLVDKVSTADNVKRLPFTSSNRSRVNTAPVSHRPYTGGTTLPSLFSIDR